MTQRMDAAFAAYSGALNNVYKISYVEKANHLELEIVVDISNDLPILGKFQALDSDGSLVSEGQMSFEYLEEGPATLYDVGVPASASAPSMEVEDAVDIYRAHREKSPSKYIAVVKEDDWKDVFNVDVIYKNGELERTERRSARTHNLQQKWSKVLSQSEIPFESLLALGLEGGKQWAFINLYDGQYSYGANKNNNDGWKVRDKSPTNNPHLQGTIADLGWPSLHLWSSDIVATNVIETDYSREHNLICVELLSEGSHDKNTGNIRLPLRELFYLNPERDYICQRHEYQREQNALWQKDRSWLDNIDPNDIPKDGVYLEEVKEFGQTETGQWYPKFIQKMAQSVVGSKTVYLETHSQFPEGIFDPENLPESDNSNE